MTPLFKRRLPPNFVVILGEGHGWSSLPFPLDPTTPNARNGAVRMPNFERLAREGARFPRFYAASPRCTPSRAGLLTGKSPAALHMTFVNEGRRDALTGNARMLPPRAVTELPESERTLPALLGAAGYAAAHFGKWHLGRANPARHGFTLNDGPNNNGGPDEVAEPGVIQTPRTGGLGADFIAAQAKAGKPFYLQISQYASRFDSQQEAMDAVLGRLFQALTEGRVADNTYILYTTDHGDPGRNPPLRGGKGHLLEGGIRVPLVIRGPGVPAGGVVRTPATHLDILPTVAALAGVKSLPVGMEGGDLTPALRGESGPVKRTREPLFFHFPHYDHENGGPQSAVLLGDRKLIRYYEANAAQLYDPGKDPGERDDLAKKEPDRVADLDRRLTEYLRAVGAGMPAPNPGYDPSKPSDAEPRPGRPGGGKGGGQGRRRPNPGTPPAPGTPP